MTLEEAIKNMTEDVAHLREKGNDRLANAEQLGIEALEAVKRSRVIWGSRGVSILPSETKE